MYEEDEDVYCPGCSDKFTVEDNNTLKCITVGCHLYDKEIKYLSLSGVFFLSWWGI